MGKRPSHAKRTTLTRDGGKGEAGETGGRSRSGHHGTRGHNRAMGAIPYILTLWCVSRVILTGIGVGAREWGGFGHRLFMSTGYEWLDIWIAWDSRWYYPLASAGYLATMPDHAGYAAWAFFPFYPWLTRAVAVVIGNTYFAALLVSNVSLLVGAWFLYKLVEQHYNGAMARKAVLFLFLFPTAYVFSCLLTEGLFLALSVGAWYFACQRNWLMASVLGMGSAMTRLVGLFMAPLLALEYLRQRQWHLSRIRPDALWIGLVPVGLVVFMATCYTLTGNPLKFVDTQDVWGSRANPLWTLWWSWETAWQEQFILQDANHDSPLAMGYGVIATIAAIGLLLWGRKQTGILLMIWAVMSILISLSSHIRSTHSLPRYLSVLFPLYMILASMRMNRVVFAITVAVLILLQATTFALWTLSWKIAM